MIKYIISIMSFIFLIVASYVSEARIGDSKISTSQLQAVTHLAVRIENIPIGMIVAFPVNKIPKDLGLGTWLECNGQRFSQTDYPDLYSILGKNQVPNYQEYFLRGAATANPDTVIADSIKYHDIKVDDHTHQWSGYLTNTAVSGQASAQSIEDHHTGLAGGGGGISTNWTKGSTGTGRYLGWITDTFCGCNASEGWCSCDIGINQSGTLLTSWGDKTIHATEGPSALQGAQVNNNNVTGNVGSVKNLNTFYGHYTSSQGAGNETAPKHKRVRYYIKAL